MIKGLVLGKFYPLHTGHKNLIRFAKTQCAKLTVLVCASDQEKIPVDLRANWIRRTFAGDAGINVVGYNYSESELPNSSVSNREISRLWSEKIKQILEPVDLVVTAEGYGDYLAEFMKIRHIPYPGEKLISASIIRRDLRRYWQMINYHAQQSLIKKIVILGTESTGKTTLTKKLSETFETSYVSEVARDIVATTDSCQPEDLTKIAKAHAAMITAKVPQARRLLFIDTDVHITKSYSEFLFKQSLEVTDAVIAANKADLYFYLENDVPFVQDQTRLNEARRNKLNLSHKKILNQHHVEYQLLKGSFEEKYQQAVRLVSEKFPTSLVV